MKELYSHYYDKGEQEEILDMSVETFMYFVASEDNKVIFKDGKPIRTFIER